GSRATPTTNRRTALGGDLERPGCRMKYEVVWRPIAEGRLADLWTAGSDRREVTTAANTIDSTLSRTPRESSESRPGGTRILIEQPLAVLFEIVEDDRRVYVLDVWRF
ncbi:MAG TPA: hypothetical protein VH120_03160, partial [Gemmataceae bacterium]|nr:hypothetical protein [Gemmataceae bacterium]